MPVKNGQKYLSEAISSILSQSVPDFELIILNDHSTDHTHNIIRSFAEADKRIKYIKDKASGLVNNLNYGVNISRGKYIARMDSDDISSPLRFEKQIELITREGYDLSGSAIEIIDKKGSSIKKIYYPTDNQSIRETMIFKTCIAHPTLMAKANILKKHLYDTKYQYVEDLELWLRLIRNGVIMGNHTDLLLNYRNHGANISAKKSIEQQKRKIKLRRDNFDLYGLSKEEAYILYQIEMGYTTYKKKKHIEIINKIRNNNNKEYIKYITNSKPMALVRIYRYIKYKVLCYM